MSDYKRCDELKEEVIALRKQMRELEEEHKKLSISNRKSKWYQRKKTLTPESDGEESNYDRSGMPSPKTPDSLDMYGGQSSPALHESEVAVEITETEFKDKPSSSGSHDQPFTESLPAAPLLQGDQ